MRDPFGSDSFERVVYLIFALADKASYEPVRTSRKRADLSVSEGIEVASKELPVLNHVQAGRVVTPGKGVQERAHGKRHEASGAQQSPMPPRRRGHDHQV